MPAAEPPTARIGHADRDRALEALSEHFAVGRLDRAEFDERSTTALGARTRAELDAVFADLPTPPAPVARRPSPAPTRPARAPLPFRNLLALHAAGAMPLIAGLWLIWLVTGAGFPWPVFPTIGMLLCSAGHGSRLAPAAASRGRRPAG